MKMDRMENVAWGEGLCHGRCHSPVARYKWYQRSTILYVKNIHIAIYWSRGLKPVQTGGNLTQHPAWMPSRNKTQEVWADEEPDIISVTFSYQHHTQQLCSVHREVQRSAELQNMVKANFFLLEEKKMRHLVLLLPTTYW